MIHKSYKKKVAGLTTSDKIDRVVTNRILALPIFALIMWFVYYVSISTVGTAMTDWVNDALFGEIIPPAIEGFLVSVGSRLPAPDADHVPVPGHFGGLRLHGAYRVHYGPYFPPLRPVG